MRDSEGVFAPPMLVVDTRREKDQKCFIMTLRVLRAAGGATPCNAAIVGAPPLKSEPYVHASHSVEGPPTPNRTGCDFEGNNSNKHHHVLVTQTLLSP